jgi:hypothetical protein
MRKPTPSEKRFAGKVLILCLGLIAAINPKSTAQPSLFVYAETGKNNVSPCYYLKSAFLPRYDFGANSIGGGVLTNIFNYNKPFIAGFSANVSRKFILKRSRLETRFFWITNIASELLHENTVGVDIKIRWRHFEMTVGPDFNSYKFSHKAINEYDIEDEAISLHEAVNILYSFRYNLKPAGNRWNISLAVTDMDYFMINQETNPILNLNGYYNVSHHLRVHLETNYKCAGFTNIAIGYFGFTLKTGAIWNF